MRRFFAVLLVVAMIAMSATTRAAHNEAACLNPRVSDLPNNPLPTAYFEKGKVWASVVSTVGVGSLHSIYYAVHWDETRGEYREFVGFHYADPHANKFFVRTLGKRVDMLMRCGGVVLKGVSEPAADALIDEIKVYLNVDLLIRDFLAKNQAPAWPREWPPIPDAGR